MSSETSQIVQALKNLFNGNPSCYGLETSSGPICVHEPLTEKNLIDHLKGKKRIGVYPLIGNKINFGSVDFDETPLEEIKIFIAVCIEKNLYPHLELSKKRDLGHHIHYFFDQPVLAKTFRNIIAAISKQTGIEPEIFPKQDSVEGDGVGNFIFLPLHGGSIKTARTVFLNLSFKPYSDQGKYISQIHRTKAETITTLAQSIETPEEPKLAFNETGSVDITKYLNHYRIPFEIKKQPNRTFFLLERCLFVENHTTKDNLDDSSIIQGADGKLGYQCFHAHCAHRTWQDARRIISGEDSLRQFMEDYSPGEARHTGNLTENFYLWLDDCYGQFDTKQLYADLAVTSPKDKNLLRVTLHNLVKNGILERGRLTGIFRKIDAEANSIQLLDEEPTPIPIKLPGNVEEYVDIYSGNVIVDAGSSNAGKTAYDLNVAIDNCNTFDVIYFSSEMGPEELTLRTSKFDVPQTEWKKIQFKSELKTFKT